MKVVCLVPGCGHYTSRFKDATEGARWICAPHWRPVPRATRATWLKIHREVKANDQQYLLRRTEYWRAWDACESAAIEAACGL